MPTKAANYRKGISRNAGRKGGGGIGAKNGVGGDGTTTTPLGKQQPPREARSAAKMADLGNQMQKQPRAHGHKYQ